MSKFDHLSNKNRMLQVSAMMFLMFCLFSELVYNPMLNPFEDEEEDRELIASPLSLPKPANTVPVPPTPPTRHLHSRCHKRLELMSRMSLAPFCEALF